MNMTQGYASNNKFGTQIGPRKSRGKPSGQSVEPPNIHSQNTSINTIAAPSNWQPKKGNALVQSPGLQTTYNSNQNMSLREQLYSVKNSMQTKIQFSQATLSNRGH